jgi:phage terminase small subunit
MKELTPKQKRFCLEYMVDFNGTQAAIRAGYSKKTANAIATENLSKPYIAEEIKKLTDKTSEWVDVTVQELIDEYKKLAFTNSEDLFDWKDEKITTIDEDGQEQEEIISKPYLKAYKDMPKAALAAISEIRETNQGISIKLHDKKGSLDSLMKYKGQFRTINEHGGLGGGPIQTETQYNINFIPVKKK